MNISPIRMSNTNKPITFGMLKVEGIVYPSTVKALTEDEDFIELVRDTDEKGFHTVVKGNWRDNAIGIESKDSPYSSNITISSHTEPLDTALALYNWNIFKRQMALNLTPFLNVKQKSPDVNMANEIADEFNRDMGFVE